MIVLEGKKERVERLCFTPDGRGVAVPFAGGVRYWKDLADPANVEDYEARPGGQLAQFSADGAKLFVTGHPILVYDVATGDSLEPAGWPRYCLLTPSPDAKHFLYTRRRGGHVAFQIALHPDYQLARSPELWSRDVQFDIGGFAFVGGDRLILTEFWFDYDAQRYESRDTLRSLANGGVLAERVNGGVPWGRSAVSTDGSLFAGTRMANILVYAVDSFAEPVAKLTNPSKKHFTGIAFHPSGKYLAATSNDKTVQLFDTATWEVARTFTWKLGRMRSVAFSPDGMLAAAGSDTGKVVVWDVDL